jgi:hypothetical protein
MYHSGGATNKGVKAHIVPNSQNKTTLQVTNDNVVTANISIGPTDDQNPFYNFAVGTYKRFKRSRLSLCIDDYTPYDIRKVTTFPSFGAAMSALTQYYYDRYTEALTSAPLTSVVPRNIGFLIRLLAHDMYSVDNGSKVVQTLVMTGSSPLTKEVTNTISKLLRSQYLAYDLSEVLPTECKPFPSSYVTVSEKVKGHHFVKWSSKKFSSVYGFYYDPTNDSPAYYSVSNTKVNPVHWPIIACCALIADPAGPTPVGPPTISNSMAVPPNVLRQWVAFEDNLFDEEFILSTTYDSAVQNVTNSVVQITNDLAMYNTTTDFANFWTDPTNLASLDQLIILSRQIYAPFLAIPTPTTPAAIQAYSLISQCKGPLYLPSVVHECIIGNTSCLTLAVNRLSGLWRAKIFHYSNPDSVVFTMADLDDLTDFAERMFRTRVFAKMNSVPEATPSKAVIPSFFVSYPDLEGDSKLFYSPYAYQYIDDHNLSVLATNLWWPTLNEVNNLVLASFNLPVVIPLTQMDQTTYVIDYIFDFSFRSDTSEIDHYLSLVRINYLGSWAILQGLWKGAKSAANFVNNNIIKPALRDPAVQSIIHIASAATGIPGLATAVEAGISFISSTPPGAPSNIQSTDLSAADPDSNKAN